jgi:hypothetical protein
MPGERHEMALDVCYVREPDGVPGDLAERLAAGKCVLFLGAGASLGAVDGNGNRLPSWGRLVDELVGLLSKESQPSREIDAEIGDLQYLGELLVISEWIDSNLNPIRFADYLQDRLGSAKNSLVHEILSKKNFAAVFTTNYDALAEDYWRAAGRQPVVITPHLGATDIAQARRLLGQPGSGRIPIIKPHGTWERPDTLVFGPRTYRQIMYNNQAFRNFMAEVFTQHTVLFVGLSFKDPNLQSLLQWVYTLAEGNIPTHYATLENRGEVFKRYMWRNFNVRLLTYPVPPADHSACLAILRAL